MRPDAYLLVAVFTIITAPSLGFSESIESVGPPQIIVNDGSNRNQNLPKTTPLHHATSADDVRRLVSQGADVNAHAEGNLETPLHSAIYNQRWDVARALISSGADVRAIDCRTRTPLLYVAAWSDNIEIARLLIEKGALVDAKEDTGQTPLSWACANGHLSIIGLLLNKGADINSRGIMGGTPLSEAVQGEKVDVVKYLLAHHADPRVGIKQDQTISDYYASFCKGNKRNPNPEMVRTLRDHGV